MPLATLEWKDRVGKDHQIFCFAVFPVEEVAVAHFAFPTLPLSKPSALLEHPFPSHMCSRTASVAHHPSVLLQVHPSVLLQIHSSRWVPVSIRMVNVS
ncbi:hypothetical protein EJB05_31913, partial [Eragrostis curvula]